MMNPKISIVMAVYNCERFVRQSVDSMLDQTFKEFEFIIVDDASTDKTLSILSSYDDPRIILVRNKDNLGQTRSLNGGCRQAKAQIIARMDADDISFPQRLEIQYNFLQSHPDIAVVGGWALNINEEGKPLGVFKTPTNPQVIKFYLLGSGDLSYYTILHPTVCMRTVPVKGIGFYNEEKGQLQGYPQDYELWFRLMHGNQFANIDQALIQYRILKHSDSRNFSERSLQNRYDISIDKINRICPHLKEVDRLSLAHMLEFRKQNSSCDGQKVMDIFEQYFTNAVKILGLSGPVERYKNQIEFFYLPQLFVTNPWLGLGILLKILVKFPYFIIDPKVYRKIFKAIQLNLKEASNIENEKSNKEE